MIQKEKALLFKDLHVKGDPLILYNIWDAGSANAVLEAGAKALATGSWSVAAAWGYSDGENIPLDVLTQVTARIVECVDIPVTIDFEAGYDSLPEKTAQNVSSIIGAGAVGINFEDQIVGTGDIYEIEDQCERISAIRNKADELGIQFFINARTDYFLKASDANEHQSLMGKVIDRAKAYSDAGASGFFVPGLMDENLISEICELSSLPVNIMMKPGVPSVDKLKQLGVARISHGPFPYLSLMDILKERAVSEFKS